MSLALETAGRIDGNSAAQRELAAFGSRSTSAEWDESKVLHLEDLAHRGCIVHLRDIHLLGSEARGFVSQACREMADRFVGLIDAAVGETSEDARSHPYGAPAIG